MSDKKKGPVTGWDEIMQSKSTYHRLSFAEGILRLVASEDNHKLCVEAGINRNKVKEQLYRLADQLEKIRLEKVSD